MEHKHKFKVGDKVFYHISDTSVFGYGVVADTGYKPGGVILIYIVTPDHIDECDNSDTQWMCCEDDVMLADQKDFFDKKDFINYAKKYTS